MLTKRIIPCLDVSQGQVVKGVCFRQHRVVGDILDLAAKYTQEGADELVFYDITASCEDRTADKNWVNRIANLINIPFCVAGGIRTLKQAENLLNAGADKISINSPALENPHFINECESAFGQQCVVIGIDSFYEEGHYVVCQYTGSEKKIQKTTRKTIDWIREVQDRGAGEIIVNCMNQDGVRQGYDIKQLSALRHFVEVPLIASGGAGSCQHFRDVFIKTDVDGALAASVFHKGLIQIPKLKEYLKQQQVVVRV